MRLDPRFYMSLSNDPKQPEKGLDRSETKTMVLSDEQELPAKVANVSRDELRKYAQCKRVGNYLLGRTVGEGSFAKVKEAIHILTGEKVAIKIIDKNRARKDRYVSKNMRREARLLQMIRHPHIVQLLEIVETSQCYYLVFEFAHGGDLMDHICKRKRLDEDEVRKFIRQIISAVEYLHRLGIMHRDLKVENLLLDEKKNIKIIDFGLSNTIFSPDPHNENHCKTQCGSPAYAAPELLVRKDYGPQIDIWSIGVNLYAMLTGRLPYTVEPFNISTLYNKMLKRQMNVIPEYLSEACKNMIHQLLNPDPNERLHIQEAVKHRWITMDQRDPLELVPCPNYLCEEELDDRILDHVEEQLKLNSDDVIRDVIQNKATKNSCVYHLLVRRLERYEREQTKLINTTPPPSQLTESKLPSSLEPSPNHHTAPQKNGLVKYSSQKTHIMENPFKTIKVALIRQKKAVKNEEKSKSGKSHDSSPHSTTNTETKPKLCAVKRVALVKFSPARRSLRGLTSCSRNSTNSPKPGRRRNYFEGLQQRRKSPKVRRRHVEPNDSLSSSANTSRKASIDNTDNVGPVIQRMRIEDKMNNNTTVANCENSKTLVDNTPGVINSNTKSVKCTIDSSPLRNIPENSTHIRNEDLGTNTSETVTHLYMNKGVVLKRDSLGENLKTNYEQEQATVQHHIFHGGNKTGGDIKDEQGCRRINGVNTKQGTPGSGLSKVVVMNAKSSCVPSKVTETAKSTSQHVTTSSMPASRQTTRTQSLKTKATPSKQTAPVIPRRSLSTQDNSSKIPVVAGKSSVLSRQSPMSPTRLAPKTPSKLPATRKTDVARLADKYDKCVSVVVVNRSTDAGKSSSNDVKSATTPGKDLVNNRNSRKGIAPSVEKVSIVKDLKNRNGLSENIVEKAKESNITGKAQPSKESGLATNPKSRGNDTKEKVVEAKGTSKKTTDKNEERLRNGLQRQQIKDQVNTKTSVLKSAKESLNASRTTSKDAKQENARKNSINNNKVSTIGNSRRSSMKTQETEDLKSWTGDERRKISNYKKTNGAQQTTSVVKRETKTTSVRTPAFKTTSS